MGVYSVKDEPPYGRRILALPLGIDGKRYAGGQPDIALAGS